MTMYKPSHLVPNLNEMMEEYAEGEKKSTQETQSGIGPEGERAEVRAEIEQLIEETRKRKRGAIEVGAECRKEKTSDLVSECAYLAWKDKLQHIDFIGERGFKKLISPF